MTELVSCCGPDPPEWLRQRAIEAVISLLKTIVWNFIGASPLRCVCGYEAVGPAEMRTHMHGWTDDDAREHLVLMTFVGEKRTLHELESVRMILMPKDERALNKEASRWGLVHHHPRTPTRTSWR